MDNYLLILYADKQAPRLEPHPSVESAQAAAETYLNHGGWSSIELYAAHSKIKRGSVVLEKSVVQLEVEANAIKAHNADAGAEIGAALDNLIQ